MTENAELVEWRIFTGGNQEDETVSLRQYMNNNAVTIESFLEIAIELVEILDWLHQQKLLLWLLSPERIFIHPGSRKIYIGVIPGVESVVPVSTDFPFAGQLAEIMAYLSPEQIGRLNVKVDERSDLYGLGVLLYELISGCLPVQGEEPAGWRHAIITQVPRKPISLAPSIPPVLSDVIMKLLEKAPENRYQSARGLLWDLQECRRRLRQTGTIGLFPVGEYDVVSSFRLPTKVFGREEELQAIVTVISQAVEGQSKTLLVSGEPGVGKTMLLNEAFKTVPLGSGFYIAGKFDQLRRNVPYAAFAGAFGELIKQLMSESKEELGYWKKQVTKALGRNGAVILEVVPELEWLIGSQPPLDELPPKEAENRFLLVFSDFVKAFAKKGRPLVLFLDDLQWADPASLKLFTYLATNSDLDSVLLVGAFRDDELDVEQLSVDLNEAAHLSLKPWKPGQVTEFLAETFHSETGDVEQLSEILYRKTGGNPLFLSQLLKLIYGEGLIYFDPIEVRWKWQTEALRKRQPEDNVLLLFLNKLKSLPGSTLEVLKWAACIGSRFSLDVLSDMCGQSLEETASSLKPAIDEGLVLDLTFQLEFLHDRVRQAVYSLLSDEEQKQRHLAIGRLLLANAGGDSPEEKVLSVMDHFNRSLLLIDDPEERIKLAGYNLIAGRKAKASAAYASALQYFRCGKTLLPDDAWDKHYAVCYEVHLELAQGEYLAANVEEAEKLFDQVIARAKTELERARIYSLKIILYGGIGDYSRAVQTGIRALAKLGVKLPFHPTKGDYARELLLYKWNMRNKRIEMLAGLPEMQDPRQRMVAELLARLSSVTMASYPDLYSFIILKTGNYSARYGNTEMSSVGYIGYSITAGSILGDYQAGEKFCQVAINLAEKYNKSTAKCIIYFVAGALIAHWTKHPSEGNAYLDKAVVTGVEAGDLLIMGYAHCLLLEHPYLMGAALEEVEKEVQRKSKIAQQLKHDNLLANVAIYGKLVSILRESNELEDGPAIDVLKFKEDGVWEIAQSDGAALATFYILELQLNYLAGNYGQALRAAHRVEPLAGSILGFLISAEYVFYYFLAISAQFRQLPLGEKKRYRKLLNKNLRKMENWALSCKENFEHKYLLMAAEKARLQEETEEAMKLYERAIASARDNGYQQNEALANELAAKFYLSLGMKKVAETYLAEACRCYYNWGALAKVSQLRQDYPDLTGELRFSAEKPGGPKESFVPGMAVSDSGEAIANLGMLHFIGEVAAAAAKETDIQKLFGAFLTHAVQLLGADKGYLILEKGDELFLEMAIDNNLEAVPESSGPLEDFPMLPKTVIRYVARTLETVVLNHREEWGIFSADPYMAEFSPGSVFCLPLLFQGIPFGVAYFENGMLPGLFTEGQLEAVNYMASQLAYLKKVRSYLINNYDKLEAEEKPPLAEPLSERELEVLHLIAAGLSNKEIAERLGMTVNTAKTHIKNIYGKLEVHRRVQAVEKAKQLSIL